VSVHQARFVDRPPARSACLMAVSIATITALFLDGLAMTWSPQLYGGDPRIALRGAGWILFGVGALWLSGLVLQRRADG
jgi:hypothetical protein